MVNLRTATVLKRANEVCSIAQSPSRRRSLQLRTGDESGVAEKLEKSEGAFPRVFLYDSSLDLSKIELLTNGATRM